MSDVSNRKTVLDPEGVYRVDEQFRHVAPGDVRHECCIINKATGQERTHWTHDRIYSFLLCGELNKEAAALEAAAKVKQKGERVVWKNETNGGVHIHVTGEPGIVSDIVPSKHEVVIRPIGGKEEANG